MILRSSFLTLPLVSANTLLWGISKNAAVQEAQLARRSLELQGRADTINVDLGNAVQAGLYFANISVGTPAQMLQVQIDTGSSDLWVPSSQASMCQSRRGCAGGTFDSSASSTFDVVGKGEFNISYVDGTGSSGDYFQDTLSIGGISVPSFEMGLALDTTIGVGILGIGYNTSEANIATGNGTIYANLPFALVDQGQIKTEAYSLWLNDLDSSEGSILFGGVDTAKYTGDLMSVEVYASSQSKRVTSFTVAFTSLSATSSSGSDQLTPDGYAQAAILDSGTTITLLPNDVAQYVFDELGATYSATLGAVVVPCSLADNTGTINYGFGGVGGPTIKVGVNDLVLPLTLTNGRSPTYSNGEPACQLAIQAAGDLPVLFGDSFLRSAYVVYDLANNRIGLAQTKFNTTDSNVVPFASAGAQIPGATSAPNEAAVTGSSSGASAVPKVGVSATVGGATVAQATTTSLAASRGFQQLSAATASSSSTKKNAGASGPQPFQWTTMVVGAISVLGMGLGGGLFALL